VRCFAAVTCCCCTADLKPSLSRAFHAILSQYERFSNVNCRLCLHTPCVFRCAADLKPSLSRALNAILEPVRQHFANNKEAAALLKQVRSYKVTR
jgi:hypothetical protein